MPLKPLLYCLPLLVSLTAHAADPDDMIKFRKNLMNANGGLMGAANALIQGKVEYKGQLADYAKALEALNRDLAALFPTGSNAGDTDAQADIWNKRAAFEHRAQDTQVRAAAFARAASGHDPKVAEKFKALSEACKSCHKDFRK